MANKEETILVRIKSMLDGSGFDKANSSAKNLKTTMAGIGLAAAGAKFAAFTKDAVSAAMTAEQEWNKFGNAVNNSGGNWEQQSAEIKSWVNELGRGSQYVKYNKKRFPLKPTASFCRALHKIYVSPKLIHDTDKIFQSYLEKYFPEDVQKKAPWMELYWWEFCWSGGEGIFLTAEHRTSSEIAIPYNNRRYIARMLTVPLEKRRTDAIPKDIVAQMNPEISGTGIVIKDLEHTDKRALLMRAYLEVFSRIHF